jgi:predicted esterase
MRRAAAALGLALIAAAAIRLDAQRSLDAAFRVYWQAADPAQAAAAGAAIARLDPAFDEAFQRLRRGRPYSADVAKGVVRGSHETGGRTFPYAIDVPEAYDPARRYQVRFQLHGGVSRPEAALRGSGSIGALAGAEQIYVMPASWDDAPWWAAAQIDNLRVILDRLKRTYNVDENRVVVSGVSDGGTGAYYIAMRDTTPYASFLPLNGFIMILANPSVGIREQLFPNNLRNKPFFIVNGGRDQLYPTDLVDPYVRHLQAGGVAVTYQPQPEGQHNTAWWPDVRDTFEQFVREHPRDPHPERVTWETEHTDGAPARSESRAHWLRIDRLRPRGAEEPLADVNQIAARTSPNFGARATGMRITAVTKGSNADALGLLPGDVVESLNGRALPEAVPLIDLLETVDAGTRIALKVRREGAVLDVAGTFQPQGVANTVSLFPRPRGSGRVDLIRDGNTVRATTRGVAAFTLLLSPDVFDFTRRVAVVVDGRTVFEGLVKKDVEALMEWAARDDDRTMLYGAELAISVP